MTGNFADWNRWDDLQHITIPTLLVVGRHDTMRVSDIEEMGRRIPNSRVFVCEQGSHLPMWDDAEPYHREVLRFIKEVEAGTFEPGS